MTLAASILALVFTVVQETPDSLVQPLPAPEGIAAFLQSHPVAETALWLAGVVFLAWLADLLTKRILVGAISRVVVQTRFTWDDAIQRRRVFRRLAHVAPGLVFYYAAPLVPGLPPEAVETTQRVALAFMVLVVTAGAEGLLTALNDIYSTRPDAKSRPIKGYLQVVKIILYVATGIVVISALLGRSPVFLLSGFGALTAVILLVFRDTILSFVASVQLTQYDMIAVGDWIEMPKYGADGDVVDIALHTIKIQNWDKTITTIPTHKFIEDSFKNWRGMSRSGGRRIKRSLYLDMSAIRFLTPEEIERFGRWELLRDYLRDKLKEIEAANASREGDAGKESDPTLIPNTRRLTNVGTLRAYIVSYLRHHPRIHEDMTLMVRQLQPGPHGLPMEIYAFSNDTGWVAYEGIQSDIFDHILAVIPELGLRVFQSPSGGDLEGLGALARPTAEPGSASPTPRLREPTS